MSDESGRDDAPVTEAAAAAAEVPASQVSHSAGAQIARAREAQGIEREALAAMLKIPLRKLELLEQDRHAELQGATFVRALAQAACRVLRIDPQPVLAQLPAGVGNTLESVNGGLNTPFRERGARGIEWGEALAMFRPAIVLPVLLVLAALVIFLLPESLGWHGLRAASEPASQSLMPAVPAAPLPAASAASDAEAAASGALAAPATSAASASAPATGASAPLSSAASAAPGAAFAAPAPALGARLPAPALDDVATHAVPAVLVPLQVHATASSWVEVSDAQGRALLSRTVLAGETVPLDGAMPFRIKIGNAKVTSLTLRGEPVNLAPWTRDNVARLELK